MPAELTTENQLTLPKRALEALGPEPAPRYFEVEVPDGRIILNPALTGSGNVGGANWRRSEIYEADVADAVAWARQRS